jgi:trehalose 6-phosphate synthase
VSVIVVSNRVARVKPDDPIAGGLAAALLPMVRDSGAIWVGSSGQPGDVTQTREFAKIESLGAGALATVDMPAKHYRGFYEGFANSALWPTLHSRPDLIHVTADDYTSYREVNAFMARALRASCWTCRTVRRPMVAGSRERSPIFFDLNAPDSSQRCRSGPLPRRLARPAR